MSEPGPLCRFLYQDGGLCLYPKGEHAFITRRSRLSSHDFQAPELGAEPVCWHCRRDLGSHEALVERGWPKHPFTDADEKERADALAAAAKEAATSRPRGFSAG